MTSSPEHGQPESPGPPTGSDTEARTPRPSAPLPILIAFWFQIAATVVSVVSSAATFSTTNAAAIDTATRRTPWLTHDQIVANATSTTVIAIVVDAALTLLSVFIMFKIKAGRSWARSVVAIVILVFLLLATFTLISTSAWSIHFLAMIGVAATTLVLLCLPPSNAYFAAVKRTR